MTANRPDHPDFWLMSEAILDLDTASEQGVRFQDIIGDVDLDSLTYVAKQRILRVKLLFPKAIEEDAKVAAAWIDGFMAGARFHELKHNRHFGTPI